MDVPFWLLIIPVLGLLVFVHELGHFATAKWFGITVTEFGFGFPPRMYGIEYRGTVYSLNWIPLGGFVRMLGEEEASIKGSFAGKSVAIRSLVLCAGSFMNLFLSVLIFTLMFVLPHDEVTGIATVNSVSPESPAEEIGLRAGDSILAVNDERVKNHLDLVAAIVSRLGKEIELTVRRGPVIAGMGSSPETAPIETFRLIPRINPPFQVVVASVINPSTEISLVDAQKINSSYQIGEKVEQGYIGVGVFTANPRIVQTSYSLLDAIPMSVIRIWDTLRIAKNVIHRWTLGGPEPGLTGPVGIAHMTGEVAESGIFPLFELIAFLSINLAIINVLPIPALDGGRLLFVVMEWIRRGKRVSPKREGLVHLVGFATVIAFIIVMSYRDVIRILGGQSNF